MIRNRYLAAVNDKPWWLAGGIPASACVAAYQPKGASSYEASKVNLANPGVYNAVDGAQYPTWAVPTGWTFNGTSQYLDSGILATQPMSVLVKFDSATTPTNGYPTIFGSFQNNACLYTHTRSVGNIRYYRHGDEGTNVTNYVQIAGNLAEGVIGFAGFSPFENGVYVNDDTGGWSGVATQSMFIGCRREANGSANYWFAGNISSIVFYAITITPHQVAALTNAMNAL